MGTLDKFLGGALALIFVYLLVANSGGAQKVLESLASLTSGTFKTLQGR